MFGFLKRFRKGDPVSLVCSARNLNRIANILEDLSGEGCEIVKPTNMEGKGWKIVVPGTASDDTTSGGSSGSGGSGGSGGSSGSGDSGGSGGSGDSGGSGGSSDSGGSGGSGGSSGSSGSGSSTIPYCGNPINASPDPRPDTGGGGLDDPNVNSPECGDYKGSPDDFPILR